MVFVMFVVMAVFMLTVTMRMLVFVGMLVRMSFEAHRLFPW
jgi:hypothetical protein